MSEVDNVKRHVDEAYRLLTGEVYKVMEDGDSIPVTGICSMAWDLQRVDAQIGPKGASMFAKMAETLHAAYVEITAAKNALDGNPKVVPIRPTP